MPAGQQLPRSVTTKTDAGSSMPSGPRLCSRFDDTASISRSSCTGAQAAFARKAHTAHGSARRPSSRRQVLAKRADLASRRAAATPPAGGPVSDTWSHEASRRVDCRFQSNRAATTDHARQFGRGTDRAGPANPRCRGDAYASQRFVTSRRGPCVRRRAGLIDAAFRNDGACSAGSLRRGRGRFRGGRATGLSDLLVLTPGWQFRRFGQVSVLVIGVVSAADPPEDPTDHPG